MKMKEILFLIFCFTGFGSVSLWTQSSDLNLQKYWYYRWRLRNNFTVVGDCQGCSLPAQQRYYMNAPQLQWGDGTIQLGTYIGVLATEYYLLKESGGNTLQTIKELYFALLAFNRVDINAESSLDLNCNINPLNGFFIRDDVASDFIAQHPEINSSPVPTVGDVDVVTSTYVSNDPSNPTSGEQSHDQAIGMLMGLRLIKEFVEEGVVYEDENGIVQSFQDGETDFLQEAINIADRIVSWIAWNDNPQIPGSAIWQVKEPCTGNAADGGFGGANSLQWAYAFAQIGYDITGYEKFLLMAANPNNRCSWRSTALFMGGTLEAYQLGLVDATTVKPWYASINLTRKLAAIGGDINYNILPNCLSMQALLTLLEIWMPGIGTFAATYTNIFLTITNYYPTNTRTYLANHSTNNVFPFNSEWLALLHAVLNDYTLDRELWPSPYIDYLNSAPCSGPYNLTSTSHSPAFDWTSTDLLDSPERRGAGYVSGTVGDYFPGEYTGLDYMLIFNLYTIYGKRNGYVFPPYQAYYIDTYQTLGPLTVPYSFNIPPFGQTTVGDNRNPIYINSFYNLTIFDLTLLEQAFMDTRAGNEIYITNGFQANLNSYFHAYIDDFVCDNDDNQYKILISDDENILPSQNGSKEKHAEFFNLYPNPNGGEFSISIKSPFTFSSQLHIMDISGRVLHIQSFFLNEGQNQIQISKPELPSGIYFIKVDGFDEPVKMIISH